MATGRKAEVEEVKSYELRALAVRAALVAARAQFPVIPKTKTATVRTTKGEYSYDYADLSDIYAAVNPVLSEHKLALSYDSSLKDGWLTVTTALIHDEGGELTARAHLRVPDDRPQTMGSLLTYGQRYGTGMVLGITTVSDDDGHMSQAAAEEPKPTVAWSAVEDWLGALPTDGSINVDKVKKAADGMRSGNVVLEEEYRALQQAVAETIEKRKAQAKQQDLLGDEGEVSA